MGNWRPAASKLRLIVSVFSLVFLVACGAAATATPGAALTPRATATRVPTATPVATSTPVPPQAVNPGKVTWMIGSFGNERFDYVVAVGGLDYARILHGDLISSDVKDGRRVNLPGIATKWEVSSDGKTWTLTIRKGVKFHDGNELTVEDVLWSLQHTMGPQAKAYASGQSQSLAAAMDRIEQTGPDRISLTTKNPISDFPVTISGASGVWIAVYPKRTTLHDEKDEANYDRNPVGTGIMKLVRQVTSYSMTFERFADHYYQPKNGLPTDKRVNFIQLGLQLVPDEATRVAALRAGESDIAFVSLAARKQVEAGGGRLVFGQEGVSLDVAAMGCWKPEFPCSDKRVRQALNYAIDKKTMQQLYGGPEVMQPKVFAFVTPSTIGYSQELDPWPFDSDKARRLLADAGYPGGKGFGKLVINTYKSASLPLLPESAQLGADFWKRELGLDVEVKVQDEASLKKTYKTTEAVFGQILWKDNDTRLDGAGGLRSVYGTLDPDKKTRMHNSPELVALVDKALAVFDPVEREKVLNTTYQRFREEAYSIDIGYINIPWGVGPRILKWQPYPLASYPSALHTIILK